MTARPQHRSQTDTARSRERGALTVSLLASVFMTILGSIFFALTDSEAILLDAAFNVVSVVMAALTVRVGLLLHGPESERFPFGHYSFESMLNAFKGAVLLVVCVIAAGFSARALLDGGRELPLGLASGYAITATVFCSMVALLLHKKSRSLDSPLVTLDAFNWRMNALLSGAVALAFGLAFVLQGSSWEGFVVYVDPLLVLVLVLAILKLPIDVIREGIGQLLLAAPNDKLRQDCLMRLKDPLSDANFERVNVRMSQVGRLLYVLIQVVVTPGATSVNQHDTTRDRVARALEGAHPEILTDVVFTQQPRWLD